LKQIAKVDFNDLDAKCPGFALAKAEPGVVGFTLSLETNGDIDIFISVSEARAVIRALEAAVNAAEGAP
jgi:hypothetical protein